MSNLGYTKDEDPRTLDELRGDMKDINDARLSLREKGTVAGVQAEIEVLKQQLDTTQEQIRSLIGVYQTMYDEFKQFKEQRVKELNVRIAGGSTTPEDIDGSES